MNFHDVEQNTEQWDQLRCGRVTSSKLAVVMANFGKAFGEPAKKYAVNIALERITGKKVSDGFSNDHMSRGHEEEPLARFAYEEETFSDVTNGGFFECGNFGCSPDGLVLDCGAIEIKSAIPSVHYERIRRQSYDSAYKWQLIANMKFPQLEWIDFVSYCSSYVEDKQLFIYRLHARDFREEMRQIDTRLDEFYRLIDEAERNIRFSETIILEHAA